MTSFVDSNVLVYLFDQDAPEKKAVAQQLLQREGSAGDLVLSTQVLQEFYVTVTRKLERPLKPEVALEAVEKFRTLPLVIVDDDIIISAIKRGQRDSIPFWDCL